MPEQLYVARKQRDLRLAELRSKLAKAGVEQASGVADAISQHLIANTTQQFLAVERWANRYLATIPGNGYDAIVTSGASNDPTSRSFGTIFAAIQYLDSAGFVTARIGVVARGGTITETAALGATTNLTAVSLEVVDGTDPFRQPTQTAPVDTTWNLGGFSTTGTGLTQWSLHGLVVDPGASNTTFFDGSLTSVFAYDCFFDGQASATSTVSPSIAANAYLFNCVTMDINPGGSYAWNTWWCWNITTTVPVSLFFLHLSCNYHWSGPTTLNCTATGTLTGSAKAYVMVGAQFGITSTAGSSDQLTINVTGAQAATCITGAGDRGGLSNVTISVSSHSNCYLDVNANAVTLGAPSTSTTYPARGYVGGECGALDVTGPVHLDVVCGTLILRGNGCGGSATIVVQGNATVALTGTAVTDSNVNVTARLHPGQASSTQKSYAFDASSARSVIIFSGKNNFPTAGTNAGTKVVIIDEDGAPPGPHASTHLPAGSDPLTTAAAGTIQPDDSAAVGTANSFARSDHKHAIVADVPGTIQPDDTASEGASTSFARADHRHAIVAGTPGAIAPGDSAAEGVSTSFARADHVHQAPSTYPPRKATGTIGDGASTSIAFSDNLGTIDKVYVLRDASTEAQIFPDSATFATNTVTFTFAVAPASSSIDVVVIG